jgi:hypothetical protein
MVRNKSLASLGREITDSQLTQSQQKALENAGAKLRIVGSDVGVTNSTTENLAQIV